MPRAKTMQQLLFEDREEEAGKLERALYERERHREGAAAARRASAPMSAEAFRALPVLTFDRATTGLSAPSSSGGGGVGGGGGAAAATTSAGGHNHTDDDCAICLRPFVQGQKLTRLPCGGGVQHVFHAQVVQTNNQLIICGVLDI